MKEQFLRVLIFFSLIFFAFSLTSQVSRTFADTHVCQAGSCPSCPTGSHLTGSCAYDYTQSQFCIYCAQNQNCPSGYTCHYGASYCPANNVQDGACSSGSGNGVCCKYVAPTNTPTPTPTPTPTCQSPNQCLVNIQTCTSGGGTYDSSKTCNNGFICCQPQASCNAPNSCLVDIQTCVSGGGTYLSDKTCSNGFICCQPQASCTTPNVCVDSSTVCNNDNCLTAGQGNPPTDPTTICNANGGRVVTDQTCGIANTVCCAPQACEASSNNCQSSSTNNCSNSTIGNYSAPLGICPSGQMCCSPFRNDSEPGAASYCSSNTGTYWEVLGTIYNGGDGSGVEPVPPIWTQPGNGYNPTYFPNGLCSGGGTWASMDGNGGGPYGGFAHYFGENDDSAFSNAAFIFDWSTACASVDNAPSSPVYNPPNYSDCTNQLLANGITIPGSGAQGFNPGDGNCSNNLNIHFNVGCSGDIINGYIASCNHANNLGYVSANAQCPSGPYCMTGGAIAAGTGYQSGPSYCPAAFTNPQVVGNTVGSCTNQTICQAAYCDSNNVCHNNVNDNTGTYCGPTCNTTTSTISGQVFIDNNGDGILDGSDTGYAAAPIPLALKDINGTTVATTNTSVTNGNYSFTNVPIATYTLSITLPAGYAITYPSPYPASINASGSVTQDFGIEFVTFNASGTVYVDLDKNGQFGGADSGFPNATLTVCSGNQPGGCANPYETLTTGADGTFTTIAQPLISGPYTIILSLTSGYRATTPKPPVAAITVGNAATGDTCSTPIGGCDANGNVINLNFGMSNSFSWMQVIGGDATGQYVSDPTTTVRGGFTDPIPETPSYTTPYALLPGLGGMPGILNAGSGNVDLGKLGGQVSSSSWNWTIGGTTGYSYNLPIIGATKTSYGNVSYTVKQSHQPTASLTSLTGCSDLSNCQLPDSFPAGVNIFTADSDVTISNPTSYEFPTNSKYIFLINGKLNIKTKILVPDGSFVLFSSSSDINIDSSVGEGNPQNICQPSQVANGFSTGCDLEGFYSTDKSFNLESLDQLGAGGNCATGSEDLKLNVAGSIVVNAVTATANSGSLNYQTRDLCGDDKNSPVFTVTERPDFVLNFPTFLMTPRRYWQEVAP